jgi:hypothetical protein
VSVGLVATGVVAVTSAGYAAVDESVTSQAPDARAGKLRVTGKVSGGSGMTIIALQADGRAVKQKLSGSGKFTLRVSGKGTTLHLVNSDGSYRGPVVLRGNAKKGKIAKSSLVYSSLNQSSGSVKVGTVTLKSGYASPSKALGAKAVIVKKAASAVAKKGTPVGAGKLGRVAVATSQLLRAGVKPALDNDRDGLPSAFDIDDNGNLVLDNVDRTIRNGSVRSVRASVTSDGFRIFSNYKSTSPNFDDVINANVAVPSASQLDASVNAKTGLAVEVIPGATLSCTGQVYCPSSPVSLVAGPTGDYQWQLSSTFPGLTANDVGAGDTFVETLAGVDYPGVLNFAFQTTPALKSYSILDSGGSVTSTTTVDWNAGNKAGSQASPIAVNVTAGEKVRLEFWRPQRQAIGSEANTSGFVDIGGLTYKADDSPGFCAATAADANGTTISDGGSTAVLDNSTDDAPSSGRTLSMDVDPATCAGSGATDVDIQAVSLYGDNSAQKIFFTRS